MTPLYEQFRPRSLADFVGNDRVRKQAQAIMAAGVGGRAIFITGASGIGKTSLARILADSIADQWGIEEIDAGECTMDRLRDIEAHWRKYGFGRGGRAYVVNECHGLRADAIRRLLVMLEEIPGHVVFIFTTTPDGSDKLFDDQIDASPLLSRCTEVSLTNQGLAVPFANRLLAIAQAQNIDLDAKTAARLVKDAGNNLRQAIGKLESMGMCEAIAA